VIAAESAISLKRKFVEQLVDGWEVLSKEVAASGDQVAAAGELCAALAAQVAFIQEELATLNTTLVSERAALAKAQSLVEGLQSEAKALAMQHAHATAAIDALLVEERDRAAVLAEKRTPSCLPPEMTVYISVPKGGGEAAGAGEGEGAGGEGAGEGRAANEDVPLPSFFSAAVEEVSARLSTLSEMRVVVLRDHVADQKQLAAVATQATAKEALAAAETAAQARARVALDRYEAALDK